MKFTILLSLATLTLPAFSAPLGLKRQSGAPDPATITQLAPPLGFQSGVNPTGTGDCDGAIDGADGKPIKIPCDCPPTQDVYISQLIANVQAGKAVNNPSVSVSFPTGDSNADKSARLTAASITLQNLNGPGKGCPVVSTTFPLQQKAINAGTDVSPAPSPPAQTQPTSTPVQIKPTSTPVQTKPSPSPVPNNAVNENSGGLSNATIESLAPPLGFKSGVNPTGTGDCDGAIDGADGKPIKIPCDCPPAQDVYISQLIANVQAGKALNNPSVSVSFPTGNSNADKSARLTAASITLQNLNGPGKGCPVVSTTFPLQQKAINAGTDVSPAPSPPAQTQPTSTPVQTKPTPTPVQTKPAPTPVTNNAINENNNGSLSVATIESLAPALGFQSGLNPTGSGDCDGAVNGANGQPIKIPCSCPPSQDVYLNSLVKNVQAGIAVNNPSVKVSFPTDNSNASKSARITAALITLQNLNGPGKGCPAVSTTLLAQQKALSA